MNPTLLEENKAKLLSEQKRLREVLSKDSVHEGKGEFPGEYKPEFPELGREEGENASEVEQFATNLAVTTDLEEKLTKIESALMRMEDGTYGKCTIGGDEIEEDRLRALPEAETCMKHSS